MSEMNSPEILVGKHRFSLVYNPRKCEMGAFDQKGSLAISHEEPADYSGAVFRYKIWIKSKEQGYVQWGNSGSVCMPEEVTSGMIFGPDVCDPPDIPNGVFGMTHAQLQHSEWVIEDVLTAKLEIELRPMVAEKESVRTADSIDVPPSCIGDNLLLLFDDAVGTDVTFKFEGGIIKAHSPILSAQSEVLKKLFSCGMRESASKEVTIEDYEPVAFKAFLRYLYSDSFASVEGLITSETSSDSIDTAQMTSESAHGTTTLMLRQLLAISHKYQVTRLHVWCERKLSELLSIKEACFVLVQAHLFEAKQLEKKCLDFIIANMSEVVKTESFASLSQQWPEVSLKVTLCLAGVSEGTVTEALEVQKNMRKRKRDD